MSAHEDLILNSSFIVTIGMLKFSFTKVSNIVDAIETEVLAEGGDNWGVHNLMKPRTKNQTLVLERGVLSGTAASLVDAAFTTGMPIYGLMVIVMQRGSMKKAYGIVSGMVTKVEITSLDALKSEPLYKTIEITHNGLHEIPIPI
jgi:phage tail-like protein